MWAWTLEVCLVWAERFQGYRDGEMERVRMEVMTWTLEAYFISQRTENIWGGQWRCVWCGPGGLGIVEMGRLRGVELWEQDGTEETTGGAHGGGRVGWQVGAVFLLARAWVLLFALAEGE